MAEGCARNWQRGHRLGTAESSAPRQPGVYEIYAAGPSGDPIPVARARDHDPNGVLYIGSSDDLRGRITGYCTPDDAEVPAQAGFPLNYRYYRADRKWAPYGSLWARWLTLEHDEPKFVECWLCEAYVLRYLSLPPLNCKLAGTAPSGYKSVEDIPEKYRELV